METYNPLPEPMEQVCLDADPTSDGNVEQCPLTTQLEPKTH